MGMHQSWSRDRRSEGNAFMQVFIKISVGKAKQRRVNRLELAGLNKFMVLLVAGSSHSFLVHVPEVILGQDNSGLTCESSIKERVDCYGLWTGWHAYEGNSHKGVICYLEELPCPGRGSLSLASKAPRYQSIIKYRM